MNLASLQASTRRKIGPAVTSVEYPDVDLNASLNEWYRTVLSWVILQTGIWEFQADMLTADLHSGQNEYVLPNGFIILNRVELKYATATSFVKATRLDDKSTELAFQNGSIVSASEANPRYRTFDNSIFLYPAPLADSVGGLVIEIVKDVADMSAAGDLPNLNPLVHRLLATGAAYDFCIANELQTRADRLRQDIYGRATRSTEPAMDSLKAQAEALAAQRDRSARGRLTPRATSFR